MKHANHNKAFQINILENGTRQQVIDWLAWNDANGIYTDEDNLTEGYEPLTIDQARELMSGQIEDFDGLESLVSEFKAFCVGAGFSGVGDARELLADEKNGLNADQRGWLTDFIERWETVENGDK